MSDLHELKTKNIQNKCKNGKPRDIYADQYTTIAMYTSTCMDVFPLCGIGMMVAKTHEIEPLDFNPRLTF